jgi:hypothetical protein
MKKLLIAAAFLTAATGASTPAFASNNSNTNYTTFCAVPLNVWQGPNRYVLWFPCALV